MSEIKVVGLSFRRVTKQLRRNSKVTLVPEPTNKYDPNALAVQSDDGTMLGYVGKADPLREKLLALANKEPVTLKVLIARHHKEGEEKLWESVQDGDLVQLWLEPDKTMRNDTLFEEVTSFTGEKVLWSEFLHECTDLEGNNLMGGSTYAKQFENEFDSATIAKRYAKKNGFDTQAVLDYWEGMGKLSANYGTSIHKALEHYGKNYAIFGHEESLPRMQPLRDAVESFLAASDFTGTISEPLITDVTQGMSGWIDLLRFTGDKEVYIEDFKTNTFKEGDYPSKWNKSLAIYQHQLNYYGTILQNHGYTVKGLVIWHYFEGGWNKHTFEFTPVDNYIRGEK